MMPNTLYSCEVNQEEWKIFLEGKNYSQWKANLSSLQHLKTTAAAAATGINVSLHMQVSMATRTPHFICFNSNGAPGRMAKLADNTTVSHQHKNGPAVDSRATSPGASFMVPAAGVQTDWLLNPPESASSLATIRWSFKWICIDISVSSKLFLRSVAGQQCVSKAAGSCCRALEWWRWLTLNLDYPAVWPPSCWSDQSAANHCTFLPNSAQTLENKRPSESLLSLDVRLHRRVIELCFLLGCVFFFFIHIHHIAAPDTIRRAKVWPGKMSTDTISGRRCVPLPHSSLISRRVLQIRHSAGLLFATVSYLLIEACLCAASRDYQISAADPPSGLYVCPRASELQTFASEPADTKQRVDLKNWVGMSSKHHSLAQVSWAEAKCC